MRLEVKAIEFEFKGEIKQVRFDFLRCLQKYASKAVSEVETEYEELKLKFKFKEPISLNTINNSLSLFMESNSIKIDEIEYDPHEKKVEVEVK